MTISYRWLDNMQEYSHLASQSLQSNFTKRNALAKNRLQMRTRNHNNHNVPPAQMDYFVASLQRSVNLPIELSRPFGVFSLLKITLERTLQAVLVLRGYVIEWVLVKGFDESFEEVSKALNSGGGLSASQKQAEQKRHGPQYLGNVFGGESAGRPDVWSNSRYQVFRTITEHANSAILHFYAPFQMESAIKAYMVSTNYFYNFILSITFVYLQNWFKSYGNLFSAKCRKCDNRLLNNMPPTWRDFRFLEPYHFECRP